MYSYYIEFVTGRGGFSLTKARPYDGPGGYFWGDPRPAPVRGESPLVP